MYTENLRCVCLRVCDANQAHLTFPIPSEVAILQVTKVRLRVSE